MLTSATSVIERRLEITDTHVTHPYEAGWALEAVFFIQLEGRHPELSVQAQISPDGLHWADRGEPVTVTSQQQLVSIDLARFGGWLRLRLTGATTAEPATVLIHLHLKG